MKNVFATTFMIASFGLLTACGGEEEREPVEAPPVTESGTGTTGTNTGTGGTMNGTGANTGATGTGGTMGGMEGEDETIIQRPEEGTGQQNYGEEPMTEPQ